jgi:hypothetical protein
MSEIIIPGIYKHFKGNNYKVICTAKDMSDMKDYVIYLPLYKHEKYGENTIWDRPLDNFLEPKIIDGKKIIKFELITKEHTDIEELKNIPFNYFENKEKAFTDSKGFKYIIYNHSIDSETLEEKIIYRPVEGCTEYGGCGLYIASAKEFYKK